MTFEEIYGLLTQNFNAESVEKGGENFDQPYFLITPDKLLEVVSFLQKSPELYIDFLSTISGVDKGEEAGKIEVVYHLTSLTKNINIVLKVIVERENPEIPTITPIYKGANWLEREVYDLFGVVFIDHPDLRRILLPANWEGHPLRKDYKEQETYHGIKVAYE